jgi:undecaprenyl-diphosphatase
MRASLKKYSFPVSLVLCAALLILTFAVVKVHAASAFDTALVAALFSLRSPLGIAVFSLATSLGGTLTVGAVLALGCIFFVVKRPYLPLAAGLAVAVAGAKISEVIMKVAIERARPDAYALFHLDSYSFPSGHAAGSMALYGFLAYALCVAYPKYRFWWISIALVTILTVGISRVYLGVHYPTDVIGGWLLGEIWILIGLWTVKYLRT